jgi:aspartate-semialdehyde dehydrogenase
MKTVGIIGWRGMVGSVLLSRMLEENDFAKIKAIFFSTTQAGHEFPIKNITSCAIQNANDIKKLAELEIIISCQGGDYTKQIYPQLRKVGWQGFWIDAASTLRMDQDSIIILDPVNRHIIDQALNKGIKNFIGGNCTVSLMLMALNGLFKANLVEWLTSMTYQAASGAGAKHVTELLKQISTLGHATHSLLENNATALQLDQCVNETLHNNSFPVENFGAPLAASLLPWIDSAVEHGQTREEWKGMTETNKILQTTSPIFVDGICVRVSVIRCHSQALTIKLTKNISLSEIETLLANANPWVKIVANNKEDTLKNLTPTAVSGSLSIAVGRIRKLALGENYLSIFTVGDQLLWGAAEPLRRMLNILL